jgi:hypothetical protein
VPDGVPFVARIHEDIVASFPRVSAIVTLNST